MSKLPTGVRGDDHVVEADGFDAHGRHLEDDVFPLRGLHECGQGQAGVEPPFIGVEQRHAAVHRIQVRCDGDEAAFRGRLGQDRNGTDYAFAPGKVVEGGRGARRGEHGHLGGPHQTVVILGHRTSAEIIAEDVGPALEIVCQEPIVIHEVLGQPREAHVDAQFAFDILLHDRGRGPVRFAEDDVRGHGHGPVSGQVFEKQGHPVARPGPLPQFGQALFVQVDDHRDLGGGWLMVLTEVVVVDLQVEQMQKLRLVDVQRDHDDRHRYARYQEYQLVFLEQSFQQFEHGFRPQLFVFVSCYRR